MKSHIQSKVTFMKFETILWDFDGIFINTPSQNGYIHYYQAAEKVAKACGINLSATEIHEKWNISQQNGKKYEMSIDVLIYEYGVCPHLALELIHKFLIQDHLDNYTANTELIYSLEYLKDKQHILVTHAHKNWTDHWTEKLLIDSFFSNAFFVKTEELCKHSIEDTYDKILQRFDIKPETTAMIEDTNRNLIFAEKSQITPILFNETPSANGFKTFNNSIDLIYALAN